MAQIRGQNEVLKFIPGLTLSQHPPEQRKDLFLRKLKDVAKSKSLHPTEFEGYTIRERFAKMGWEQLLNLNCERIYRRVVIQWTASLSRNGDELTGSVDGKSYTITPAIIRDFLKVDTRTDYPYACFNLADFQTINDENITRWVEACKIVFGRVLDEDFGFSVLEMTPLVKVLWGIGLWTFHPRLEYTDHVLAHEIYLLHALYTGDYRYSFALLMIDDIWGMYEYENQQTIPHGCYISEILYRLGAVPEDENVEVVDLYYRQITRRSFRDLSFSESPTRYIIDDQVLKQQVTFLKKVTQVEDPPQLMPIPNPLVEMTDILQDLINKQSSQLQKQHDEMLSMVSNMQKQMEHQALEAERREQERERREQERQKWDDEREHKRERLEQAREIWAEKREQERVRREQERERREQEREIRAEEREQERERCEKEREKRAEEREKLAEIRAHAIIWDIERQRYLYEQEQEQLRMTWNQVNCVNGVDEFQFPQLSRTSFHPPQAGSRYYDPTQSNEIPKAFQSLYHDIYGRRD